MYASNYADTAHAVLSLKLCLNWRSAYHREDHMIQIERFIDLESTCKVSQVNVIQL